MTGGIGTIVDFGPPEEDKDVEKIWQAELVDNSQIFDSELVAANFVKALEDWKNEIVDQLQTNTQDKQTNKTMMTWTRTLKKPLNCIPTMLQHQMHKFGDGTVSKSKASGVADQIKVNPQKKHQEIVKFLVGHQLT